MEHYLDRKAWPVVSSVAVLLFAENRATLARWSAITGSAGTRIRVRPKTRRASTGDTAKLMKATPAPDTAPETYVSITKHGKAGASGRGDVVRRQLTPGGPGGRRLSGYRPRPPTQLTGASGRCPAVGSG